MTAMQEIEARRERLKALVVRGPAAPTEGVNHVAVISSDLERSARFYRDVLGLAVVSVAPNRDEPRSTHVNIDLGGATMLSLFDFPDARRKAVPPGAGDLMHLALSLPRHRFARIEGSLKEHKVPYQRIQDSIYFHDPDGLVLELTLVS